jgi:hypothetical protein
MALSPAPLHADINGRLVASDLPKLHPGFKSNVQGGLLEHGAAKTKSAIQTQAKHASKAGVTMRGSSRIEYHPGNSISGATIPGVNPSENMGKLLQNNAGLRASSVYDKLGGTTPHKVSIGGRKRRSKTNGRHHRNRKRNNSKSRRSIRSNNRTKRRKNN